MPEIVRKIITITVVAAGSFVILAILHPSLFIIAINIVWIVVFTIATIFIIVGILTVIGRKSEASQVIDLVIQGSVTAIDFLDLIKLLIETFIEMLKKTILLAMPYAAFFSATVVYLAILVFYKDFGKTQDVALMTIVVTMFVTVITGFLTRTRPQRAIPKTSRAEFVQKVKETFSKHFIDAFEISIFALFLTIDSTHLFFLPKELNTDLVAQLRGYDMMVRGYSTYQLRITLKLVMIGLVLEFLRNAARLLSEATYYYKNMDKFMPEAINGSTSDIAKALIRVTVSRSKDEIMRFTAFTTFMMIVFLLFPRLKLVALVTASATNLLLDILIPSRLTFRKSDDLINRTFNRLLKLENNNTQVKAKAWN